MLIYLFLINALGFWIMHYDKRQARKNLWRVPEKTLFTIAIIGGSLGCILGMYSARHKTKHPSFTTGMPVILAVQTVLLVILVILLILFLK